MAAAALPGRATEQGLRRTLLLAAGVLLGFVVGRVLAVRRAHVIASMRRAGIARPERTASAMYASLGTGLVEFLAMAFKPSWQPALQIEAQQGAPVVAEGQGIVLATAHTGNWDLVACAAASRMPLTVVTKRLSIGLLDRLWQRTRARRGVRLVSEGKAAQALSTALRRGEAVAMLIDQAPERSRAAIRVDFLGAPALVDLAPALVALRARVPLVAVFPVRRADGAHAATIAGVLVPPCRPSRDWAEHAMHTVTRWLEDHVRRHPEQWLWMHRRWKGAEGATKTRPEVVSERVVA